MSSLKGDRVIGEKTVYRDLEATPQEIKITTTMIVDVNMPSVLVIDTTAARNVNMPAVTAAGAVGKMWYLFNKGSAALSIKTSTGGAIVTLTNGKSGVLLMLIGTTWRILLKSTTT